MYYIVITNYKTHLLQNFKERVTEIDEGGVWKGHLFKVSAVNEEKSLKTLQRCVSIPPDTEANIDLVCIPNRHYDIYCNDEFLYAPSSEESRNIPFHYVPSEEDDPWNELLLAAPLVICKKEDYSRIPPSLTNSLTEDEVSFCVARLMAGEILPFKGWGTHFLCERAY